MDEPESVAKSKEAFNNTKPLLPHIDQTSIVSRILLTSDGLRPVWRLVLYVCMYKVLKFILEIIMSGLVKEPILQLWLVLIAEVGLFLAALIPAFLMGHLEERPFGAYGLPIRKEFAKLAGSGALWGITAITFLMLVMCATGVYDFGYQVLHGFRIMKFAMFWGMNFLIVGFYEEFLVRGYTQFTLTQEINFWPAAAILSIIFGTMHLDNPGENWLGIAGAILIGFFFCLTLRRTGSLWFAVGFHTAWDWGESYLYSVPDSGQLASGRLLHSSLHGSRWLTGGIVGPEGSVLIFILLPAMWFLFDKTHPAKPTYKSSQPSPASSSAS